jgi:pilus assembly protein CpaB
MKSRTAILLVLAVICGLGAAVATSRWLNARTQAPSDTVDIWVVKAEDGIKQGAKIDKPDDLFERKSYSIKDKPKAAIEAKNADEQLKGKIVNKFLAQGQFITQKDFQEKGDVLTPPAGMTASTIKVAAESTAGGFVLPNSHVDVIWLKSEEGGKIKSRIMLQDVLVLAIGHMKERPADQKNSAVANPDTATLAVTDQQAKDLQYWESKGKIKLALRSPEDKIKLEKHEAVESPIDPDSAGAPVAKGPETVEVWVAAEDLAPETRLTSKVLKKKRYLKEAAPKNALSLEDLQGKVLKQPVHPDSIICALDLEETNGGKTATGSATGPRAEPPTAPLPVYKIELIDGFKRREVEIKSRPAGEQTR